MAIFIGTPYRNLGSYYDEVIADGPRNYWRLNELVGTLISNDSGAIDNTLNMSVVQPSEITLGVAGGSVGDNDTAIESSNVIDSSGGMLTTSTTPIEYLTTGTVEAIIAPRVTPVFGQANTIMDIIHSTHRQGGGGGRHFRLRYSNSTGGAADVSMHFHHDGSNDTPITAAVLSITLPLNKYTHVVGTYELGGAQNGVQLFVNGVASSAVVTMIDPGNGYNGSNTKIGVHGRSTSGGLFSTGPGVIDEVAMYDYILSPARIAAHAALVKNITV